MPSRSFAGRPRRKSDLAPPGQFITDDFPVLTAGPTPLIPVTEWQLEVSDGNTTKTYSWDQLNALPRERVTVDLHCVTHWSKLDTTWEGVLVSDLFEDAGLEQLPYAFVTSYRGYTTNLPTEDLVNQKSLVVTAYDNAPIPAEHGGPVRLLVPHLYLWKSAKWVRDIKLSDTERQGFWETNGYHDYGDPWREQRYHGD